MSVGNPITLQITCYVKGHQEKMWLFFWKLHLMYRKLKETIIYNPFIIIYNLFEHFKF